MAALGDSITAGSPVWDPSAKVRTQIEAQLGTKPNPRSQFEYWAARADPNLRFRNCGVFGERTDQILTRLGSCAHGADALLLQGGINDIAQALHGGQAAERRAVSVAARNLDRMVVIGKALGIPVALTNVLPWNNGFPYAAGPIRRLNRDIAAIGRRRGVPVLDFYSELQDPQSPAQMRTDWTIDGDHPSVLGYELLGRRVVAPALRRILAQSG